MISNGFAEVNGTKLYYEMLGEGEPLVLLHSGFTDLRMWDDQFEVFSKYFKVIRYDVRGFGKSQRPTHPFSHYEDLKALLNYLQIERSHLLGVSMGGGIAIDFTLQYSDYVDNLMLSGPSLNGFTPKLDEASKKRSEAGVSIAKKDKNFFESIEFMLNDSMWRQSNDKAKQRLKNMFMDTYLEWDLKDMVEIAHPPAVDRLSDIDKRTLLILGTEDSKPIFEIGQRLELSIPLIEKNIISNTGHLPNLDKPEEFNNIVLNFLIKK